MSVDMQDEKMDGGNVSEEAKARIDQLLERMSIDDVEALLIEKQIYLNRIRKQSERDIKLVA